MFQADIVLGFQGFYKRFICLNCYAAENVQMKDTV